MDALGMVEVLGFATSVVCADAAAKAADVRIIALDNNKPKDPDAVPVPLIMTIKIEGEVSAVEAAVEAACKEAKARELLNTSYIIPRPGTGTEKLAVRSNIAKQVIHTLPDEVPDDTDDGQAEENTEPEPKAQAKPKSKPKQKPKPKPKSGPKDDKLL